MTPDRRLTPPPIRSTLNEDMQRKMIHPLPEALGATVHDRFRRFAKAVLAVHFRFANSRPTSAILASI